MELVDEETVSPEDELVFMCQKVVRAGIWLVRNGYGKMQVLPYAAPSGCYWRCAFHPPGRPSREFYRYSTGSGHRYLQDHSGGRIAKTASPAALARAIMVSVPEDVKERCHGEVGRETEAWLGELERAMERGLVPQAFYDGKEDMAAWDLVRADGVAGRIDPMPGYVVPGEEAHWTSDPFWRAALVDSEKLLENGEFLVDLSDVRKTEEVVRRLSEAFGEAGPDERRRLLIVAIAAFAKGTNRR